VPLVDADDPDARPADVVQHGFRDFEPDAETLETCRERPAKIVQRPRLERLSELRSMRFLMSENDRTPRWPSNVNTSSPGAMRGNAFKMATASSGSGSRSSFPFFAPRRGAATSGRQGRTRASAPR
jgi:hypothetical protein